MIRTKKDSQGIFGRTVTIPLLQRKCEPQRRIGIHPTCLDPRSRSLGGNIVLHNPSLGRGIDDHNGEQEDTSANREELHPSFAFVFAQQSRDQLSPLVGTNQNHSFEKNAIWLRSLCLL